MQSAADTEAAAVKFGGNHRCAELKRKFQRKTHDQKGFRVRFSPAPTRTHNYHNLLNGNRKSIHDCFVFRFSIAQLPGCGPNKSERAPFIDFLLSFLPLQDLLVSDQSSIIIKSLSKLPRTFDIVLYPTLLTIICDNDGAKSIIGREFDLKVGVQSIFYSKAVDLLIMSPKYSTISLSPSRSASKTTRAPRRARRIKCCPFSSQTIKPMIPLTRNEHRVSVTRPIISI